MSRILVAWELGGNLGHILPLLALARALRAKGHDVLFAPRDIRACAAMLQRERFGFVQAPRPMLARQPAGVPASYPEILLHGGFADPAAMEAQVFAWRNLFALSRADILLADHAPAALLAARGLSLRRVHFGTGFTSPPRVSPMPSFRPWQRIPLRRLRENEARALAAANRTLKAVGGKPLDALYELLDADEDILATLAELDHYGARQQASYRGPLFGTGDEEPPVWPDGTGKKVFVYLRPASPAFRPLYAALRGTPARVLWFAPGLPPETASKAAAGSIRFALSPLDMSKVTALADAAIFHGGHGTAAAMLLAGVPALLFPDNVEQLLVARRLAEAGAGAAVPPAAARTGLATILARFLADESRRTAASAIADRYRRIEQSGQIDSMAKAVLGVR